MLTSTVSLPSFVWPALNRAQIGDLFGARRVRQLSHATCNKKNDKVSVCSQL